MTTLTRRSALALFAGTAAVGALSACGTGGGTKNADGSVTLRVSWWGNDVRNSQTQQVIDAFQQAHPNIKIQGEPGVWSGYWDLIRLRIGHWARPWYFCSTVRPWTRAAA